MVMRGKQKTLACRLCGDVLENAGNRDVLSGWTHNHPSRCPYRQDRMPALNGVHVGDVWRNLHTKKESVVTEIRLGGVGVYTDREPVFVLDGECFGMGGWPMWSLVEHWEPLSRPGEYPVPWTRSRRFRGRSAYQKWRGVGMRGRKGRRQYAIWHSYHRLDGLSIAWEYTNVLWQTDPETELRKVEYARMREAAQELMESGDELLARMGAEMAEIFAEAA